MRVTGKTIEYVTSELVGPEAVPVVLFLKGKNEVSEFDIAKKLKIDIHYARAVLYKLFENNLAMFIRRKDKQKGWYVCYWDFRPDTVPHHYNKIKKGKLEKIEKRLETENGSDFYMCKNACCRMDFDKAFASDFKCSECGSIMNPQDNSRTIEFLQEQMEELKKEIKVEA